MIVIRNLEKSYGSNRVLDDVSVTFEPGSVHALLGPNGAGKSTLLGCLSGATRPDAGTIEIAGREYSGFTPRSALEAGTGIIYQHFQLIGDLSIVENLFLGDEPRTRLGTTDRRRQIREASDLLASLGLHVDVRTPVSRLAVGQQQIVEIARAVRRDPALLILDEPTAALSNHEIATLMTLVRTLADRGIAIVYVTHLLREVFEISDHTTVLRDGAVCLSARTADLTMTRVVEAIAPQSGDRVGSRERALTHDASTVLEARDLQCGFTGPVSLTVREGELVGVYGLLGSGRSDLLETIAGVRTARGGRMMLGGRSYRPSTPARALRRGIALVAGDRRGQSLFPSMSSLENLLMPSFSHLARVLRRGAAEKSAFAATAGRIGLRPADPRYEVDHLSGGNAQKVAVGRWLAGPVPTLLLLDEPTQGVDVGAREEIYQLLRALARDNGLAIIFSSSDPDEITALADRVVVLHEGAVLSTSDSPADASELVSLVHSAPITL